MYIEPYDPEDGLTLDSTDDMHGLEPQAWRQFVSQHIGSIDVVDPCIVLDFERARHRYKLLPNVSHPVWVTSKIVSAVTRPVDLVLQPLRDKIAAAPKRLMHMPIWLGGRCETSGHD